MPRRSNAAATLPRVDGAPTRIRPPADMPENVARHFRDLMASTDPQHFRPCDVPLLRRHCEIMTRLEDPDVPTAEFVQLVRLQSAIAIRLRICPSARSDPKTAGRWKASAAMGVAEFASINGAAHDEA